MHYTDLVFDLYGTLVDIHTDENDLVWEKTALYFGFYGAQCTGSELKTAFLQEMQRREIQAGQNYEYFPDIPFEQVLAVLLRKMGAHGNIDVLAVNAAQLFRISSIEYIRPYPHVKEALAFLRQHGFRLWLLSNAQQVFTAYELRCLGLDGMFDGILLSSDYQCRKPDQRFYRALLEKYELSPESCLMIGNDRDTDIAGAMAAGMATLYMHTNLTPASQAEARPERHPTKATSLHYEYEGHDWNELMDLILHVSL